MKVLREEMVDLEVQENKIKTCEDCLCADVCKYNDGVNLWCKSTCPCFKDKSLYIEVPCEVKPDVVYLLTDYASGVTEARRTVTYKWNESVLEKSLESARKVIEHWKQEIENL